MFGGYRMALVLITKYTRQLEKQTLHYLGAALLLCALLLTGCAGGEADQEPEEDSPPDIVVVVGGAGSDEPEDENPVVPEEEPFVPDNFFIPDDVRLDRITDLVLITGQSNALGASTAFDASLDQPNSRVYAFTDVGWRIADLQQVWDLTHPGNFSASDPEREPFNNFGLHFGKTIAENRDDRLVAFVLITAPGQEIAHWDLGGEFFGQIRNKALNALNQIPHKSSFDGILWHQGESDAADSDYYTGKLNALITNFRNENWFGYEKPFICGETIGLPVNNRLNRLNTDGDDWTACVEGEGLPSLGDDIHFSAEGLRIIGARYGWQYVTMRPRPPGP